MTSREPGGLPLPMFPLGTVLFPGTVIPLHVFEPRYRALVQHCLSGDGRFGVVLIERGSEVGGGDVRTDHGTLAGILQSQELADGRWVLAIGGLRRLRVVEWVPDDPYPQAVVELVEEDLTEDGGDGGLDTVATVLPKLRRALALAAELGDTATGFDVELGDEPLLAGYRACAYAPLGPIDHQRLLTATTHRHRIDLLDRLLDDQIDLLSARLGSR